jgi:acetyl esterase/lipase
MDDGDCGETARETGVTIVSVDHRFAPRHPFPAAIDDCYTAWQLLDGARAWLGAHLER